MERALYFFVHLGIPLIALLLAFGWRAKSLLGAWLACLFFVPVLGFLYLWGQWPLVGSRYLAVLPIAAMAAWLFKAARSHSRRLPLRNPRWLPTLGSLALLIIACLPALGVKNALAGRTYSGPHADIAFPMRGGRYYVSSGGSHIVINNHLRTAPSPQDYALDLSQLGPLGGAASNVLTGGNEAHHIFGEPVYAPCDGRVREAEGDAPENDGPSMAVTEADGRGNFVWIDCGEFDVALVHLQHGSVQVRAGDPVRIGLPLGRVGNSGFSEEPHLHLQACVVRDDGICKGIPMRFEGLSYVRNDVIDGRPGDDHRH